MKAIIFAGGVGTRLWPLSRKHTPKQFLGIVGEKTTFQLSVDRLEPDIALKDIYVGTGESYKKDIAQQMPGLPEEHIFGEPAMRDLGPAVGLATAILTKTAPHEPVIYIWADHIYKSDELYRKMLQAARAYLEKDPNKFILIGEKPRFASQNLGWIAYGKEVTSEHGVGFHKLEGFHYRPDLETAEKYFTDNHHAWNIGDFVSTPAFIMSLFEKYSPELYAKLMIIQAAYGTSEYNQVLHREYPQLEKISLDNAITEKMDHSCGLVITEDMGWADIGAWEALKEALEKNKDDNVTQGKVFLEDSRDSLVYNYDTDKLIVGIDLDDVLIVNTGDVLLVTKKTSIPKIKTVVKTFEESDEYSDLT